MDIIADIATYPVIVIGANLAFVLGIFALAWVVDAIKGRGRRG